MVYCDSQHTTHELKDAQNLTDGHVQLYTVQEVRHHTTPSHWTQREWDLGIDEPTDSSDTENGPATYTQGMAPLSLLQIMNLTKTSDNLVVLGEYGFFISQIKAGHYWYWVTLTSCIRHGGRSIRTKQECNWWETIWRCSEQAWNIETT